MLISCLIAAAPLLGGPAAGDAFALRASHVHVGDGQVVLDAFVLIEDGVVKSVSNNAPRDVRVVEVDGHVAPGFIGTAMTDALTEDQQQRILGAIPAGRMGTPEEVASSVVFLASEESAYITGQTLHVNGGMAMI